MTIFILYEILKVDSTKKMGSDNKCEWLAERIAKILRQGLKLSTDVWRYIDSTFSNPSEKELEKIISDESNCEKDSLLELIFFPDETIQIQLEDLLESKDFQKTDEKKVLNCLLLQELETTIHFPGRRGSLKLTMPHSAVAQFVNRLNISNKPDKRLIEAINKHVSKKSNDLIKVKLRNSRIVHSENAIIFLRSFFEKMDSQRSAFFECLDFIVPFLDELQDKQDISHALFDKRKFYLQNLKKAENIEEYLKKNNIETSILQGAKIPHINKEDMLKQLGIIDKIILLDLEQNAAFSKACT